MATTTYPRIAVIGGGPGGLTLALTLHRRGIPYTVYERETSADSRAHLGGIDRKSTRLNSSHSGESRMPSSA